MGKYQSGNKPRVQRDVQSSSSSLEVISHESFVQRREGMNSCRDCQKERFRTQHDTNNRKEKSRRKQHSKFRPPVDQSRTAVVLRQHSLDGDSDVSSRSTDEDQYPSSSSSRDVWLNHNVGEANNKSNLDFLFTSIYGDVASIPEFVPQTNRNRSFSTLQHTSYNTVYQNFPDMFASSHKSTSHRSRHHFFSDVNLNKAASEKNLTDFLSVMLNAHKKELSDIECNLSREFTDAKIGNILNNVAVTSQSDAESKRKNMAECENVELICNDLSNCAGTLAESSDESDTSSDKASVTSGSDVLSDDSADMKAVDETNEHEFTSEQLQQLVEFTTGVPLFLASKCSDNASAFFSYQYFSYDNPYHGSYFQLQKQQQLTAVSRNQHKNPKPRPRVSISSESDISSDAENTTTHSSSPLSSCSSIASLLSSGDNADKFSSEDIDLSETLTNSATPSKKSRKIKITKKATVSLKCIDNYWANGVHTDHNFNESVYVDLTDMDVSISVTYHAQSTIWPYIIYNPITESVSTGITLPIRFNNQLIYPDLASSDSFHKHELVSPQVRPWIPFDGPKQVVPAAVFSVLCYNVLCDKLCTKSLYAYCPTWALNWQYRKRGILNEILKAETDILTLQEIETEQYHGLFYPELARRGYEGIFLPKSRSKTMNSDKEKAGIDGCAIFYKRTKFDKLHEYHVEFSQLATKEGISNSDSTMINRVGPKDNVAIVAVLGTRPGAYENSPVKPPSGLSQILLVATTHIFWDPQNPDVKIVQTMMLMEELHNIVKEATMTFRPNAQSSRGPDMYNNVPLLLCGDFNSLPDSGVYEYLSKGTVNTKHKDFEGQVYSTFTNKNITGNLTHNFQLKNAYNDIMPFTNYTFDFKGIIDYIFYSETNLHLHGVLGLQDQEWFRLNKIVGCPHPFIPSDHFPLMAEFSMPVYLPKKR